MLSNQEKISIKNKYAFYQTAVQGTEVELKNHIKIYRDIFNKTAYRLREDFSGTFLFCCEWIKSNPKRSAIAIDIDPEPLEYGRKYNTQLLSIEEKKRLTIFQDDVRTITYDKSHIISASNFSFNVFKKKDELTNYFSCAHKSLDKNGILILEVVGGKEFIKAPNSEEREYAIVDNNGKETLRFTYYWKSHRYDSKTKNGLWSIDIKQSKAKKPITLFEYDWRIWSPTEISSLLKKTGYRDVIIYQLDPETYHYQHVEKVSKDPCWIAKIVGIK